MLPLAHTFVSTKATEKDSPLLIFGSILPDISTTSAQQIGRDQIHNSPREFANFIYSKYPQLSDMGLGVRLHSQVDGGADFYSDDLKKGYAKIEGAKISRDVAELLEIPDGDISLVLAHNFIEMAVDLHLYNTQKKIWEIYNLGILGIEKYMPDIVHSLSEYLNLDETIVKTEINNLIAFLHPTNLISIERATEKVALPLIRLRFNKEVSKTKTMEIGIKALDITKATYLEYMENAATEVKKNIVENS